MKQLVGGVLQSVQPRGCKSHQEWIFEAHESSTPVSRVLWLDSA